MGFRMDKGESRVTAGPGLIIAFGVGNIPPDPPVAGGYEDIIANEMVGYAAANNCTGGMGLPLVEVTNTNSSGSGSLREALSGGNKWIHFQEGLSGTINVGSSPLIIESNTTIDGRGANVAIRTISSGGAGIRATGATNFIIMYITLDGTGYSGAPNTDGINIRTPSHTWWVHQCTFEGWEDDQISQQSINDVTSQGWSTISWCKFFNGTPTGPYLLNSSQNVAGVFTRSTVHHCHVGPTNGARFALARRCYLHMYNNYIHEWQNNASGGQTQSNGQCWYENNVCGPARSGTTTTTAYKAQNTPIPGRFFKTGNLLIGNATLGSNSGTMDEDPASAYSYTAEPATTALRDDIIANAGWQDVPFTPAHEGVRSQMVGFAKHYGVTGGSGGPLVTCTNLNNSGTGSLRQAIADASGPTWIRFASGFDGTINLSSTINLKSNITIDGRGSHIRIVGPGGSSSTFSANGGPRNIILLYLDFDGPVGSNNDGVFFGNSQGDRGDLTAGLTTELWWLYHCDFKEAEDECLAYRRTRGRATLQSCFLEQTTGTEYVHLMINRGAGLADAWDDVIAEHTIHRCWYKGEVRLPRISVPCNVHLYNNYHNDWRFEACHVVSNTPGPNGAEAFFENDMWLRNPAGSFTKICDPTQSGFDDGRIRATGNLLMSDETIDDNLPGSVFTPPYSYTALAATSGLRDTIVAEAGWQNVPFPE